LDSLVAGFAPRAVIAHIAGEEDRGSFRINLGQYILISEIPFLINSLIFGAGPQLQIKQCAQQISEKLPSSLKTGLGD